MKSGTRNEMEGQFHKVKGKVKEKVGEVINDPKLKDEGTVEKVAGAVQEKIGQIQKVLKK